MIKSATGCTRKIVFFHIPLQSIPRLCIAARDLQSSQPYASVQSLLLAIFWMINNSPAQAKFGTPYTKKTDSVINVDFLRP